MVNSVVLLGAFNSDYIADRFDHANDFLFAHAVGTNGTNVGVSDIESSLAKFYLASHSGYHLAEITHVIGVLLKQMQY